MNQIELINQEFSLNILSTQYSNTNNYLYQIEELLDNSYILAAAIKLNLIDKAAAADLRAEAIQSLDFDFTENKQLYDELIDEFDVNFKEKYGIEL
jgi:hypothetical protein